MASGVPVGLAECRMTALIRVSVRTNWVLLYVCARMCIDQIRGISFHVG